MNLEKANEWGISSAGRAGALQASGQRFDPAILHQKSRSLNLKTQPSEAGVF